jgi:hypothetical protein
MKHLPAIFFAAISFHSAASAGDIVTLTWKKDAGVENDKTAVLELKAGESARVKFFAASDVNSQPLLTVSVGGITLPSFPLAVGNPAEFGGPSVIRLVPFTNGAAFADGYAVTFEVTRPASPSVTPSNAAVIPEDANGTFSVILESSTDLITWTAANPGDYSGNTVKRFFRTRIVKK